MNKLKLAQSVKFLNIIPGFCWILLSMLSFLPDNRIIKAIQTVFTAMLLLFTLIFIIRGHEQSDEMGHEHFMEAYAYGYLTILIELLIFYIIYLVRRSLPLDFMFRFIYGCGNLACGFRFLYLEKEG